MKRKTLNYELILIFMTLLTVTISQQLSSKKEIIKPNTELNCQDIPEYKNLEISTNFDENSEEYDIPVMKDCKIDEQWRVKEDLQRQCVIPMRAFEGEDNIRRSFRFTHHKENNKKQEKIMIKNIVLDYPKNVAETTTTKSSLTLYPGESVDLYVDYDCLDMDEDRKVNSNWFKLRVNLEFENGKTISFEYIKICTASYSDKLDFSHIVIIGIVFLIVFASVKDYLKSKVEGVIVEKFTEIKNPENLIIISFLVTLLLFFLGVVNLFHKWVYLAILIVGPLSVAMITEAILRKNQILLHYEIKSYEIPYLGSITLFFVGCLACGFFVLFLWLQTENWLVNNIFSISISIVAIRIFKFTSFKFLMTLYTFALTYQYIWVTYRSNYYGENYKLTNNAPLNLPVNLLCPELVSSPFSACNSLPIADIILPGIFLMYSKKFDEFKSIENYFYVGVGAFGVGLLINLIVYYAYMLPTSSFLYTGPLILISTLYVAYSRGEIYEFLEGFSSTIYENREDKHLTTYFEQQRRKEVTSPYRPPPMEMNEVYN